CCGERRKTNVFGVWDGGAGGGWISLKAAGDLVSPGAAAAAGEEQAMREMAGTVRKWDRKSGSLRLEEATRGGKRCAVCVCVESQK
ncbi:hypothetical protein PanWU01x14_211940, partial [Parasponia andersonii]